jgi:hypothetical protein
MTGLHEFLRERFWLGGAVGGALWLAWLVSIVTGGGTYDRFGQLVCTDHLAFYSAARMIGDGQADAIYDLPSIALKQIDLVGERWRGKYEAYRNPPFYALLYRPTAYLPYVASAAIWTAISLLATFCCVRLLAEERHGVAFALCLGFPPTFFAVAYGQNSPLSAVVLSATFIAMRRKRYFLAGCVAGLLSFKPTLLIGLAVWCLFDIRRLWPCAVGVVATVASLCGASWLIVPEAWAGFLHSLSSNAAFDQMDWWKNLTPRSFWRILLGPNVASQSLTIITLLHAVLTTWYVSRRWKDHPDRDAILFAMSIPLTLWLSPHALLYEWHLLIVSGLLLWRFVPSQRTAWSVAIAALFVLSLVGPPLTQFQLKWLPYAFHLVVPAFGMLTWWALRRLEPAPSPRHNR